MLIDWLLPTDRAYYHDVKQRLLRLPASRGEMGVLFGDYDEAFAETITIGEVLVEETVHSVLVRLNDDRTGASISVPTTDHLSPRWTLSSWSPGTPSPTAGTVREIALLGEDERSLYTLALSPSERVLWLHHSDNQFNQLIPVTGVLIELARVSGAAPTDRLSNDVFFDLARESSDQVIVEAVLEYNKRAKKFDASKIIRAREDRRIVGGFLDVLRRRR